MGRIKLLEDTNGDGIPDRSTIFADSLTMPTGVMRWKKGILVTDAPDLLYFEDTDGDGKADVRRVVLTLELTVLRLMLTVQVLMHAFVLLVQLFVQRFVFRVMCTGADG